MAIFHIVMFTFKCLVPQEEIKSACDQLLGLGSQCIHPTTKQQYVKVLGGGRENSPEGLQNGVTHCFVFKFETAEDRAYYLDKDPAHLKFVDSISDVIEKVQVVDFTPGEF